MSHLQSCALTFLIHSRPEKILSSKKVVAHKPEEATVKTKAGDVHRQPMVKRPRQVDKSMFTFLQKLRDTQAAPSRYANMLIS